MTEKAEGGRPNKAAKTAAKGTAKRAGPSAKAAENEPGSGERTPESGHQEPSVASEEPGFPVKPLRPAQCRGFMRKRIAEEFPKIVHGFLKEAKTGNCAHVKLASDLLEKPAAKAASRKKGSAERMLEELRAL